MKYLFFLIFIISNSALSYIPTLESLLRNGTNANTDENTVFTNLKITEIDLENNQPIQDEFGKERKSVIKLLTVNSYKDSSMLCQVNYASAILSDSNMTSIKQIELSGINQKFTAEENPAAELFYSIYAMLGNNDSKPLLGVLKRYSFNIRSNKELINKEKVILLGQYKKFLESEEEEALANPLRPESEEARKRVQEILKGPFLTRDETVKRVREGKKFYWLVNENNIKARFDEEHRMRELWVRTTNGEYKFIIGPHKSYSSELKFPEFIWFTDANGKKYEIKPLKHTMFADSETAHRARLKRYNRHVQEAKAEQILQFDFLM